MPTNHLNLPGVKVWTSPQTLVTSTFPGGWWVTDTSMVKIKGWQMIPFLSRRSPFLGGHVNVFFFCWGGGRCFFCFFYLFGYQTKQIVLREISLFPTLKGIDISLGYLVKIPIYHLWCWGDWNNFNYQNMSMVVFGSHKRWYNPPIGSIYHLYTTSILCSGGLSATCHLLRKPVRPLKMGAISKGNDMTWYLLQSLPSN